MVPVTMAPSAAARVTWVPAYVGLGSNLGDPVRQVRSAFDELAGLPDSRLVAVSRLYLNPPMGDVPQPDYVNAVAALLTQLTPAGLLGELKRLERLHGRDREHTPHWGPRTLDLDLLVVGEERCQGPSLTLPHAGTRDRNFVLWPLLEVAPGLWIPGTGYVQPLAAAAGSAGLVPVE